MLQRRSSPVPARRDNVGAFHLTTAAELAGTGLAGGAEALRLGATVMHPQFGIGRIVSVEGDGSRRKGTVAFTVGPSRTFVLAMSPLRVLGKAPGPGMHPPDASGRDERSK